MDKEKALELAQEYADLVTKEFSPKQILMFGSYVYGTPREWSDIDIAVIYDKYTGPGTCWDGASRLSALCGDVDTSNLETYIEPHLMELADDPWGLAHKVQKIGKVLYQKE